MLAVATGLRLPTSRRNILGLTGAAVASTPLSALAVDLQSMTDGRIFYDSSLQTFAIEQAQKDVKALLADEDTFKTMVTIGIPTGNLQMPPQIMFSAFKKLEERVSDPDAFMDAAIEYVEYSRDANDLIALVALDRRNGGRGMQDAIQDHLDRSLVAARGCAKALDRMVPLLPAETKKIDTFYSRHSA